MDNLEKLKLEFHQAMLELYKQAKVVCGYNGIRFLQMIETHTGVRAAQLLLRQGVDLASFEKLAIDKKHPELTMEALVIDSKWKGLFTDKEINEAKKRLKGLLPIEPHTQSE